NSSGKACGLFGLRRAGPMAAHPGHLVRAKPHLGKHAPPPKRAIAISERKQASHLIRDKALLGEIACIAAVLRRAQVAERSNQPGSLLREREIAAISTLVLLAMQCMDRYRRSAKEAR